MSVSQRSMKSMPCPCGTSLSFDECCGRHLDCGIAVPTAEVLMRSRYSAYALGREAYLLATWHPRTRPQALSLRDAAATKWVGLEIKRHEMQDAAHAIVEFIARYKINGRAYRLHEVSRFAVENGIWFYIDGHVMD